MQSAIQKSQHYQPNFINGGVRYNLQGSKWRQLKPNKPNSQLQFPLLAQQLQYTVLKKSIYTFAPSTTKPTTGSLYSYNFVNEETKQWVPDRDTNVPELRRKYALVNYDGRLCMFGGVCNDVYYNDFNCYCSYSNMWRPVLKESNTVMPAPRIPLLFSQVDNGNLLLLGGICNSTFLYDAYLLVNFCWKQLKLTKQHQPIFQLLTSTQGLRHSRTKTGLYFFGGIRRGHATNQLYHLTVDQQTLTIKLQPVISDQGPRPAPRSYHGMQRLGDSFFAICGGFNAVGVGLRDFWVYDENRGMWMEIHPLNNPLMVVTQPRMYFQTNTIYIQGHITQKNTIRKTLIEFKFPQFQIIRSQICSNCIKRLDQKQKQQHSTPKKPFISNGLLYNLSIQISSPFQALSLLLDCAQKLQATELSLTSDQTTNKLTYIDIRFNGQNLTRDQYASIIGHSYLEDPVVAELIDRMKLGAMRLGKSLVYVEVVGEYRRVFLFSADSLIISHYHELYAYFAYEERIRDQWLSTQEGIMHKKFITNLLHSYFNNPSSLINSIKDHCFLILQTNVIMTNQKAYYGELIPTSDDITQCKNNKKVQFLSNIGFTLSQDPQTSLSKYLQYLYLSPSLQTIHLQQKTLHLQPSKYLHQLQKLSTENPDLLKPLLREKIQIKQIQAQCHIYDVLNVEHYRKELKGVFLYYRGRLINRFEVQFGDLFWQKFYRTRYRTAYGLWMQVGCINILKGAEPKITRNQFKNQSYFNYFIRYIKKQIIARNSVHGLGHGSKSDSVIQIQQEGKPTKSVKRDRQ